MRVRYRAQHPWWGRGIHLVRMLPEAQILDQGSNWDLDIEVKEDRQAVTITTTGKDIYDQTSVSAERMAFLHALFNMLSKIKGEPLSPWGVSTGIRPGKLAAELMVNDREEAVTELCHRWLMTPAKAQLLTATVANGYPLLQNKGLSIYISVPFCPSRCHYCSFASLPLAIWQRHLPRYVGQVARELAELLQSCQQLGYAVNSIYVGGGTPTALPPDLLAEMLAPAAHPGCEFTVEAGRPDTLTWDHISALEDVGVTRVSVNAQYPVAETLAAIGRQHSVQEFYTALDWALNSKIDIVNSDLIIGLPGETVQGFTGVLNTLAQAGVQNITLHALALKRGAKIHSHYLDPALAQEIAQAAYVWLDKEGYLPYYLYRQKNIASNLENVGFALPDSFCYYNIASIAEAEPVLGVGAGAVSKLVNGDGVELLNNPRDPNQYLQRRSSLVLRKLDWLSSNS